MLVDGMRVHLPEAALLACALFAACSGSGSSGPQAVATIGPDGGVLAVEEGALRGFELEVPPGVLPSPVELRVFAVASLASSGSTSVSYAPSVGQAIRVEPVDLATTASMRLRLPYRPGAISQTGAGNVDVRQVNPWTSRRYDPSAVDALEGWVEIATKTLDRFQVELGAYPAARGDYLPPLGEAAALEGGLTVTVGEEGPGSVFAGAGATHLEVDGPSISERLVFAADLLIGRGAGAVWAEEWSQPVDALQDPAAALFSMTTQPALVTTYFSGTTIGAAVTPLAYLQFGLPIRYRDALYTDIAKVIVDVAYDRPDLGAGDRRLTFWLSPEVGLLRLSVDGQVYERLP